MRYIQLVLFIAIAMLYSAKPGQAAPVINLLSNYDLLANTPGQKIPIYASGIVPNNGPNVPWFPGNVVGVILSVAINNGGMAYPAYGGLPGPTITSIDVDTGPTIWVAPNSPGGHNGPHVFNRGQIAQVGVITGSGWVNVTDGLLATLVIDTTGFFGGTYPLALAEGPSGFVTNELGNTELLGQPGGYLFDDLVSQITIVPEPSSVVLAAIGLTGLAAWGWRRRLGAFSSRYGEMP